MLVLQKTRKGVEDWKDEYKFLKKATKESALELCAEMPYFHHFHDFRVVERIDEKDTVVQSPEANF